MQYSSAIKFYPFLAFPIIIFTAYVLNVIVYIFPKCKKILYVIIYAISIGEVFIIYTFGTRFSLLTYQLVAQTNINEAKEFFSSYILSPTFVPLLIFFITVIFVNIYLEKKNIKVFISYFLAVIISIVICIFGFVSVYRDVRFLNILLTNNDATTMISKKVKLFYNSNYIISANIVFSARLHSISKSDINILKESIQDKYHVTCNYKSPNIVLILGESFNKYHSQLYGYKYQTNPLLSTEKDSGNLFLMNDVVTPFNSTTKCLHTLFSFSNQDNNVNWIQTTLFPAILKDAGYFTSFISNQESLKNNDDLANLINNFLVLPDISSELFNIQNDTRYIYDMDLISAYINSSIYDRNSPKLTIFHLIGQHVNYKERYPSTEKYFTKNDYIDRIDLSDSQKEILADYDNATRYNDKVIYNIIDLFRNEDSIIIYLSDHGDEVYDYRIKYGRSHEPLISKGRAKTQYEVPFMIWMSNKYIINHPDIVEQVKESVNRPFITENLPHLILELAGIECKWFDPTRSLINKKYDIYRKRLLEDLKYDYDEIMR